MKKKINIAINQPCHQDPNDFTPTSQGFFCAGCQKEVIDFTKMDQQQVYNYFQQERGQTCGRFRKEQLGSIVPIQPTPRYRLPVFTALLSLLALTKPVETKANTAEITTVAPFKTHQERTPLPQVHPPDSSNMLHISGKVIEKGVDGEIDEMPMIGATIAIKNSKMGTFVDIDGNFAFSIPKDSLAEQIVITVSFVGYDSQDITINTQGQNHLQLGTIRMTSDNQVLGGAMVISGGITTYRKWSPRGMWHRFKWLFRKRH